MSAFTDWLNKQLTQRNLSISKLAKLSGKNASQPSISRVLSGQIAPTADFCLAIARALGESEINTLYIAGHIREKPITFDEQLRELCTAVERLTPDQRKIVTSLIEMMLSGQVILIADKDNGDMPEM